jgi:hypothetical protein
MENSDNTTGLMSGGMESWKLITALIQMMFCLGSDGSVLPNHRNVRQMRKIGFKDTYLQDVTEVVLSAASSTVEMYMAMTSKELRKSECGVVQYLIECACFNHLRLARIFKAFRVGDKFKGSKLVVPSFEDCGGGNKLEYLRKHMMQAKRWMGADPRQTDSEISECLHKLVVKRTYAECSKIPGQMGQQMALNLIRKRAVSQIQQTAGDSSTRKHQKRGGREKEHTVHQTESEFGRDYLFSSESTAFCNVLFDTRLQQWNIAAEVRGKYLHEIVTDQMLDQNIKETMVELQLEEVEVFVVEKLYVRDLGYPEWKVECNNARKMHAGVADDEDVEQKFSGAIAIIGDEQTYVRCLGNVFIS